MGRSSRLPSEVGRPSYRLTAQRLSALKVAAAMSPPTSVYLGAQIVWLLLLALPVACISWTITHEELFAEPRETCVRLSRECAQIALRKFFYLFTCEYCFSHWVTLAAIALTRFHLLLDDWRGYIIAFFAVVWVTNVYLSLYVRLRVDIRGERTEIEQREKVIEKIEAELPDEPHSRSPAA
jgi:hypothetical protein